MRRVMLEGRWSSCWLNPSPCVMPEGRLRIVHRGKQLTAKWEMRDGRGKKINSMVETISKDEGVRLSGRWSTGWLKPSPNVRWVMVEGRWSTPSLKVLPKMRWLIVCWKRSKSEMSEFGRRWGGWGWAGGEMLLDHQMWWIWNIATYLCILIGLLVHWIFPYQTKVLHQRMWKALLV